MSQQTSALAVPNLPFPRQASKIHADAKLQLTSDTVVCDAYSTASMDEITFLLQHGAIVSSSWQMLLSRQRAWWPDADITSLEIVRQVTPDMLTGHWQLRDVISGEVKDTNRLTEAVNFLTHLKSQPVVPLARLYREAKSSESDTTFVLHVRAHFHDGELSLSRWTYPFRLGKTVKIMTFQLP